MSTSQEENPGIKIGAWDSPGFLITTASWASILNLENTYLKKKPK